MKVLQGFIDIGGQANRYSRALQQQGVYSEAWLYERTLKSEPYDKLLDFSKNGLFSGRLRKLIYLFEILSKFNILHIHKGFSLFNNSLDLLAASNLKKTIIVHYRGSEIRNEMQATSLTPNVINKIKIESNIAHKVLVKDGQLAELIQPYFPNPIVFPNIVDIGILSPKKESYEYKNKLKIVHIPSNPKVKGTDIIRREISKIKNLIEYKELTSLPHNQVLVKYKESDIIIDQILTGTYGNSSLEGMALGTPVLNYLNPTFTQYEPEIPPIININEGNLCDVILYLNNNRQILAEAGEKGINFINKYHTYDAVGKKLIDLYTSI